MSATTQYDTIIVGAGSAGCVLAARLSEDRNRKVLLLEAGPDYTNIESFPPELARAGTQGAIFPGHPNNWSFVGNLMSGHSYPLPRGKVVGGSSAINGTYFVRGRQADFDRWAELGNDEWSFDKVLPYFIRCETDHDFKESVHGVTGPIPVRRATGEEIMPVTRAFVEACRNGGFAEERDKNGLGEAGVGLIPRNSSNGFRMNTAATYLLPCRDRANLTILDRTVVERIVFDARRAVGVDAVCRGQAERFSGAEVVLCAGGIKTPHLLMMSGIGSADHLRGFGIEVICDSPGVGRNVMDHPTVSVMYKSNLGGRNLPANAHPLQACLNFSSSSGSVSEDLQITCAATSLRKMLAAPKTGVDHVKEWSWHSLSQKLGALSKLSSRFIVRQALDMNQLRLTCALLQPRSVGQIRLASDDPHAAPEIQLNYLSHPDDIARLRIAVRTAVKLLKDKSFNRLEIGITAPHEADLQTDDNLDAWIVKNLSTSFHTSCGARMGPETDDGAVVDQYCRVRGVTGCRVVDTSIMPTIVRRGTAATAIMIAERAAEFFGDVKAAGAVN